ncbi:protein neprosin-like [Rutidosis leptorrhynchoides]|uniref:protein neprosin-like n=1 Tax=Rutidosis leptorrhynchoides TaxID=125765 RepID=UPI003A9A3E2C
MESDSTSRSTPLNVTTTRRSIFDSKKHKVKSILSEDGDIIDCIDIYKQPAFNHPALKSHTIQMVPTKVLKTEDTLTNDAIKGGKKEADSITITSQLWHRSGSCPKGTIPIRRIQKHFLNKKNVDDYGRKKPSQPMNHHDMKLKDSTNSLANHSVTQVLAEGFSYSGAKVDIRVWTPYVEKEDEYSTSRVLIENGGLTDFELVETGWAVNPSVYNDHETRLYTYWTADGSKTTGCFDLTCPGFVQVTDEIALGAAIYPVSKPNSIPYQITVYIYKDPMTNNWWVNYGESINIGYWPGELFSQLWYHGLIVKWGGEVYSQWVKGRHPHTATYMGNGMEPPPMWGNCGTMTRMRVEQNSSPLMKPEWTSVEVDEYRCYDILYEVDYVYDPILYYGGPGRTWACP